MAADNQVVLEGIAKFEALQRAVQQLVADAEGHLGKLGRNHPLTVDVASAQVSVDKVLAALRRTRDEASAPKVLRVRTEDAETRVAALSAQVKQLGLAVTDFGPPDPLGRFRASVSQAGAAVTDFVARTTVGSEKFGRDFEGASTRSRLSLEKLQREIRETAAAGSPIPPAVVAQVDRLETEYRQATTAAHQFRVAQAQVREGIRSSTPPINELNASLGRATSAVKAFVVAAAVNELRQLGTESFTVSERLKAIDRQLEAALGSSEKAAEGFAFVKAESDRLGFGLLGAVDAYARLASAARGTSLEGEGINRVFTQFAERATVAQLSAEDFAGVIRALEQIISKGTLSMEELRQQLGDRLPGTLRLAGKALGFTEGQFKELFDLVKSNSVSSIEFIQLFGDIVQKEVAGKVVEASQAATAEVNRLKNAWLLSKDAAGSELAPAVAELAKTLRELLVESGPTLELFGKLAGLLLTVTEKTVRVHQVFKDFVGFGAEFDYFGLKVTGALAGIVKTLETFADAAGLDRAAADFHKAFERISQTVAGFQADIDARAVSGRRHLRDLFGAAEEGAPALREAGAAAEDMGDGIDFAARKMDGAINEIILYAAEVEKAGKVQRVEADKIVKAVDQQLKAIRELPGAEGAAFALREQQLVSLREKFFEFTTAYEKQSDRQAKAADVLARKEEAALERRAQKVEEFFERSRRAASLPSGGAAAGGGGEESAVAADLQRAREELQGLKAKPIFEEGDQARIAELEDQIRSLGREAQRSGAALREIGQAASEVGEQASQDLEDLRRFVSDDDFKRAFQDLPADIAGVVEETVRGYEAIVAAQGATAEGSERFRQTLITLFQGGGEAADQFAARLANAGAQAGGVGETFNALRAGVDAGNVSLAGTAPVADAAAVALSSLLTPAERMAEALKQAGLAALQLKEGTVAAGESLVSIVPHGEQAAASAESVGETYSALVGKFDEVDEAGKQTGETYSRLAGQLDGVTDSSEPATAGLVQLGDQVRILKEDGEQTGGTLTDFSGKVHELEGAGKKAGEGLKASAEGIKELGDGAEKAATGIEKAGAAAGDAKGDLADLGEAAGKAGESGKEGAQGIDALGKAATSAKEPWYSLVTALEKVPPLKLDEFADKTATGLTKASEGAGKLAGNLDKVGTAATENSEELDGLAQKGGEIADKWEDADRAVAGFNERAGIAIGLCKDLQACLAGLAAS